MTYKWWAKTIQVRVKVWIFGISQVQSLILEEKLKVQEVRGVFLEGSIAPPLNNILWLNLYLHTLVKKSAGSCYFFSWKLLTFDDKRRPKDHTVFSKASRPRKRSFFVIKNDVPDELYNDPSGEIIEENNGK